jgi:ABC-type Na+ efflux pump permease subunit
MFIGLLLIPPVLLKLGSTGYRFVRYYSGARAYREKGPPLLPLRLLAPVLAASTVAVLASGVWLLALGRRSDTVLQLHQISFIVFGIVFAIHLLAYAPRMVRSLRADWGPVRRLAIPGTGARGALVAASLGAGLALALTLLSAIEGWHGGHLG